MPPTSGPRPKRHVPFTNWAKTFHCIPACTFQPKTEEEVLQIIAQARQEGRRVRAVGSGHSPSDLTLTRDYLVKTDLLNRLISVDSSTRQVTVEAGMTLHSLHRHLQDHGLSLPNLGSISDQSVAGIIATATHGTGVNFGVLSTLVVGMRLLTTSGPMDLSPTHHSDIFSAAKCHLGCLGIVTRATLQCEPAFQLDASHTLLPLTQALDQWDALVRADEHVRFWWFPYTDTCLVWKAHRVYNQSPVPRTSHWLWDSKPGYHLHQTMLYLLRCSPSLIPAFTRWYSSVIGREVGISHEVFNFDCLFPQYVNEWAVPLDRAPEALKKLRAWVDASEERVHFPVEVRFGAPDDIWLSPAYGRPSCWIGIIMYRPYGRPVPYHRYWKAYEEIMRACEGRPHWAKAHPMAYEELRSLYPKLDDFSRVRRAVDPEGMFLNAYMGRHLVPGGQGGIGSKL
ncbi:MAG: D-arabinono-1,4-lactone oxidase-domain-containing protein [Piptocephalis tieghemiana]|nr:MAG: D-arabinono-1,4-lactone oxidase-domain-containing protein [Piptocephalis tieghemiana]